MRDDAEKMMAGYTLLEVMISMLILAIAFLALIAVQLGALNGYVSARDNTEATELAQRTGELLRIEALQWNADGYGSTPTDSAYDTAGDSPFDVPDTITTILGANGWTPLVNDPVDIRYGRVGFNATHLGGKFCIYARGNPIGGALGNGALQMQVAVVYPGPNATLTDCTTINNAQLNAVGGVGDPPALEQTGRRVVYHGIIIVRRPNT